MRKPGVNLLLCTSVLFLWAVDLPAQVYKYVDENGITTYTTTRPAQYRYQTLDFPCYASDPKCRQLDWQRIPLNRSAFANITQQAAETFSVDEALLRAIIHAESAFQPDALSPKGAQGLMQLMPANQTHYGITDPYEPAQNILAGAEHLSDLLAEFSGNVNLAVAAYNAGSGAVKKYGDIPPYAETREYVRRVNILYRRYGR